MRGTWRVNLLLVAVAVVMAVISGSAVWAVMDHGGEEGSRASRSPSPKAPSPTPSEEPSPSKAGDPLEGYIGQWVAEYGGGQRRNLTISAGAEGDQVMILGGVGPDYNCLWKAKLKSAGPPPVLGRSVVTAADPKGSCKAGGETRLELIGEHGDKLRRVFVDGSSETVVYDRL